jgi:hypothetical protein
MMDMMAAIKQFFSATPQASAMTAANSFSHTWIVFACANVLLAGLGFLLMVQGAFKSVIRSIALLMVGEIKSYSWTGDHEYYTRAEILAEVRKVNSELIGELPNGSFFLIGMLLAIVALAIVVGGVMIMNSVYRANLSFVKTLNMASSALIINTVTLAVAIIFSFFWVQFSFFLLFVGVLGSMFMIYDAVRKLIPTEKGTFWFYLGIQVVNAVLVLWIGSATFASSMKSTLGLDDFNLLEIMQGFSNMF